MFHGISHALLHQLVGIISTQGMLANRVSLTPG